MRTPPFLVRLAASAAAVLVLLVPGGTARGGAPAAPDAEKKDLFLETTSTVGLLEPPIPVPIPFGPQAPAGAKVPASLGALKYAIFRVGEPQGPLEGFLLAWHDAGKDASSDSLYVDPDADGDLANGGNGDLEAAGDMRTRRATLPVKRPPGDPDNVSTVPFVFVRRAGPDVPWYAVPVGRRSAELSVEGKTYAVALTDGDSDGAIKEGGKDVLWFDANADGVFDPNPAARERLAIPAIVKAGPRLLKLSVPFPSGLRITVEPVPSGEPQAGLPAPTPTLLAWRLAFAAASPTAIDERAAAVAGARSIHEDAVWAWLDELFESLEAPVRAAALEGLGDPAFGADKSADKLKEIVVNSTDAASRHRALGMLAGHPGGGAANLLKVVAENRARPLGERIHALRSLAKFPDSAAVVKRHMVGSDPPELKAAAYEGLAERSPDDLSLHRQALELGSPAARGEAIAALGRLNDPQGLTLARKEASARPAQIRAGAVRVLVQSGKRNDLMLAIEAGQDDAPIEKFTDFNRDGKWQPGEPFVDSNGNGIFDPDAGVRRTLKDALRGERSRPEVLKFVLDIMLDWNKEKEEWVRDVAVDVVLDLDDPAARTALFKRLDSEKSKEILHKIIEAAAKAKAQVPVDALLKLSKNKDEGLRGAASAAAVEAALDDPRVHQLVRDLLGSTSWGDRVQGCEAAGHGGVVEAVPDVILCLAHERWSVRAAAIEALGLLHPKEAFEPLLALMKDAGERTRLSLAANRVLFRLTGMELPDDPDQWRSWDAGHAGWQVPAEPPVEAPHVRRTVAKFFGIPIESKRIVFVIDHSGSMNIPDSSGEKVKTRWELLVEQLTGVLGSLPTKGTKFNLFFFAQNVESFKPKCVDLTPQERDAAKRFIASIEPRGETNVWGGLVAALDEPDVDTIILLTDGEPSVGEFTKASDILREVSIKNRFRRVVISCVSVGQDSGFLRDLAARNHGAYTRK